jgi:hypothetical protein
VTAYEVVVDALRANGSHLIERGGDKAQATCPAHDDHTPSLSIFPRADGKGTQLKCHTGCELPTLLAAIGLTFRDLYDDAGMRDALKPNADYRYPGGRVNRRRTSPNGRKRFTQSGAGDASLFGADKIPAGCPLVFVTEGEKAALAIGEMGGVAVATGGASRHCDMTALRGVAEVRLVVDRDTAGLRWAQRQRDALAGIADRVRFVRCALDITGADAVDHIAADLTLQQLEEFDPFTIGYDEAGLECGPPPDGPPAEPHQPDPSDPPDGREPAHLRYLPLDWHRAFAAAPDDTDWLVGDLFIRGHSYSLVSTAKAGKSLLMLDVVAAITAGHSPLGSRPGTPLRVLYVDHENTRADLVSRLEDMGYGPDDLAGLIYLSFPAMPALDTPTGGRDLLELATHHRVDMVVIDTLSRVVAGEENSADTIQNLYRFTLAPLKSAGITVVRLDHQGYDTTKAGRGSSAKNDDVDAVWRLTATPGVDGIAYVTLSLDRQRGEAHPPQLRLVRSPDPVLHHERASRDTPPLHDARVAAAAQLLDGLGLPADTGARRARLSLREAGHKFANNVIADAVKARRANTCGAAETTGDGGDT